MRHFFHNEPWFYPRALPWHSTVFAFGDELLWNAVTRAWEVILFCGFFSPPYFTCVEDNKCSLSLEEMEGPGFWLVSWSFAAWITHHAAVKENNFSWASWCVPAHTRDLEPCWSPTRWCSRVSRWCDFCVPLQLSPLAQHSLHQISLR